MTINLKQTDIGRVNILEKQGNYKSTTYNNFRKTGEHEHKIKENHKTTKKIKRKRKKQRITWKRRSEMAISRYVSLHNASMHSVMSDFCDSMDCSPPGSSVHGISKARILEWVDISSSRGMYLYQP